MNKYALHGDLLLLLTACLWGFGFVAQRSAMEFLGPFTFNAVRFLLGSLSLLPFMILRKKRTAPPSSSPSQYPKTLILASSLAGTCLFMGVSLQQIGLIYTTAGKGGFISGLYVVLTPIFSLFLGRKTGLPTWIGAGFTLTGLFFLSSLGQDRINLGDLITAGGAVFWTFHILLVDRMVHRLDPLDFASGQFGWCGLCSLGVVFFRESLVMPSLLKALIPIIYGGIGSVGLAYTLQIIAQQHAPPAHATIILCLEGVFAAIGGVLLLGESLGPWTFIGFAFMLGGMIATQWERSWFKRSSYD